jgi:thiamine thiazole synthase
VALDDVTISRAIVETYSRDLAEHLEVDVAIAGAGPAGLVAAHRLAEAGKKVAIFERRLSIGGGMWGGGMMFNRIVVQDEARRILDEFGIPTERYAEGYFVADAVLAVTTICSKAMLAGARVLNLIGVEDVMLKDDRVCGLVLNWSAVTMAHLHVDPLTIGAGVVVDATGHDCEVVRVLERKGGVRLDTPTGGVAGEKPMWADRAERLTLENTRAVYPGLYVAGMAANAVHGGPRMGPIFGGMLLSGERVADLVAAELS